jgi:4-hydroxy-3-methylbut-2-enyl diphosphate reductase
MQTVGVTAGASAPEVLVRQVIEKMQQHGAESVTQIDGIAEKVVLPLPKSLTTTTPPAKLLLKGRTPRLLFCGF